MSRDAYAEAFRRVTGRPLVALPQLAGASDSEIFFESLALNEAAPGPGHFGPGNPRAGAAGQSEANDLLGQVRDRACRRLRCAQRPDRHAGPGAVRCAGGARRCVTAARRDPDGDHRSDQAECGAASCTPSTWTDTSTWRSAGTARRFTPRAPRWCGRCRWPPRSTEYGSVLAGSVYVGDSVRDVAAATVAGVRCLGVATGRSTVSELREAGADPVLLNLSDTSQVVAAISR